MDKSPAIPEYETQNCCSDDGLDLHKDFSLFLEQAKSNASDGEIKEVVAAPCLESCGAGKTELGATKKNKKSSWTSSLFSWLRTDKKSQPFTDPSTKTRTSKPNRGYVSGPMATGGRGGIAGRRSHRQTSGNLTSLLINGKRGEAEIPYMCLSQLNEPHGVQSYGPLYLVK